MFVENNWVSMSFASFFCRNCAHAKAPKSYPRCDASNARCGLNSLTYGGGMRLPPCSQVSSKNRFFLDKAGSARQTVTKLLVNALLLRVTNIVA